MPIGIVTEEEFEKEVVSYKKEELVLHKIELGRGESKTNVPQELREIIAEEKTLGTPSSILEKAFGVKPSTVSAYGRGENSLEGRVNPGLIRARNRVANKATEQLMSALESLSTRNLDTVKATDLSTIAKDMAQIADKMVPVAVDENKNTIHVHLHAPKQGGLDDYEVIDV